MFISIDEISVIIGSGNLDLVKAMLARYENSHTYSYEMAVKHNQKHIVLYLLENNIHYMSYFNHCVKYDNKEMFQFGLEQKSLRSLLDESSYERPYECKYKLVDDIMTNDKVECLEVLVPFLENKYREFISAVLCTYFTVNRSYRCIRYLINRLTFKEYDLKHFIKTISSRPYVVNFEQKEWREFFQTHILKILSHNLNNKWRLFKEREEQVNNHLENHMINDLSKIVRSYEY
jgi:hypothetical protein